MTIKQCLAQHPGAAVDLMTPGGYCFLTPGAVQSLLQGGSHTENQRVITAEELLAQLIVHAGEYKGNNCLQGP